MENEFMSELISKIFYLIENDKMPAVWYEIDREFARCEVDFIQHNSEYMGGVNSEQDIYQYRDHDGAVWEIEVDRHDDDGHELDDSEIVEHATRVRWIVCAD